MKKRLFIGLILAAFVLLITIVFSIFVMGKVVKNDDQKFILKNETIIKKILWQRFDVKKEKIKSIKIIDQTIKGTFDNGGDVGGDYDITFLAIVNGDKNKIMNIDINFPNAQIGPFTFVHPNPYKKKMDMTISKDNFYVTVEDKGQKNGMGSWWNFIPKVWAENYSLDSQDEHSSSHKTIEEIYAVHRQNIIDYLAKTNNVSPNKIVEENVKSLSVNSLSKNQFELDISYLNKMDKDKTIHMIFTLSRENLSDIFLPIRGSLSNEKEQISFSAQKEIHIEEKIKNIQEEVNEYKELKEKEEKQKEKEEEQKEKEEEQKEKEIFEKNKEKCQQYIFKEMIKGKNNETKTIGLKYKKVEYNGIYNFSIFYETFDKLSNKSLGSIYEVKVELEDENLKNTNLPVSISIILHYNGQNIELKPSGLMSNN
ncbi:hypothetical protein EFE32_11100 [Lactococcus lactis subsp. lactis]|uniref:hypothetical protein n=1 Tax=Lactococcus lactis TaxID=1358 RepID=UPI00223B1431|nr:hypothetical protein [Lactococcus lactis]MCT0017345.1 hypothetical protein [Lactococcus lactis subsp. lactis]